MLTSSRLFARQYAPRHDLLSFSLVLLLVLGLVGGLIAPTSAGILVDSGLALPGLDNATLTWADYDTDGDPDLLLMGSQGADDRFLALYKNENGTLTEVQQDTGLVGLSASAAAWGDYDNDGDPDVLLTGLDAGATAQAVVYRNNGDSTFTPDTAASSALPGWNDGDVAWGDYDNDGDLDLLCGGESGSAPLTEIYRNDDGIFVDADAGLESIYEDRVAWGDYDNDGDLDVLLSGNDLTRPDATRIYTNNGGSFSLDSGATTNLPNMQYDVIAWSDYDSDGDLDLFFSGIGSQNGVARVYETDGGSLTQSGSLDLTDISVSDAEWLDYDSDGDPDLVLSVTDTSLTGDPHVTRVYLNDEDPSLPGNRILTNRVHDVAALDGSVAGADYNNDGAPDLIVAGSDGSSDFFTKLLANERQWSTFPQDDLATRDLEAFPTATNNTQTAQMGDYDNDGDLDLLLITQSDTLIYDNDGTGRFTHNSAITNLASISAAAAADWGDYDGDGDLDIVLTGSYGTGVSAEPRTFIYQYDNGAYTEVTPPSPLPGVQHGGVAWSTPDANGQSYLALTGMNELINFGERFAHVYIADATNRFTETADLGTIGGTEGIDGGALDWGDYDKDGDEDLLMAGGAELCGLHCETTEVYYNDNGTFVEETIDTGLSSGLEGITRGDAAWVDFDSDDDLDIFVTGYSASIPGAGIFLYRNNSDPSVSSNGNWSFEPVTLPSDLSGAYDGTAEWADYDGDGDPDLLIAGQDGLMGGEYDTKVYRNDGEDVQLNLINVQAPLPRIESGVARWGDYDGDGDPDIFIYGYDSGTTTDYASLFENRPANDIPPTPEYLASTISGNDVTLSWIPPSWRIDGANEEDADYDRTPAEGFSYALRVGTTPGGSDIVSPMAASDGTRFLPRQGNIIGDALDARWQVRGLADGTYYWSVQAIDHSLAGSPFASEETFTIDTTPPSVTINQASDQDDPTTATTVFFTATFNEPVTGFESSDVLLGGTANPTSASISGSGASYTVEVSGISGSGTITASIKAGAAQDSAGNASLASTSTDNTVTHEEPDAPAPEIVVLEGSSILKSGSSVLDFGGTTVGAPLTRTLTVRNLGTADLTLGTPNVAAGFMLANGPLTDTLVPGAEISTPLVLEAAASGSYSGTLALPTNDSDENPFRIAVRGNVASDGSPILTLTLINSASTVKTSDTLSFTITLRNESSEVAVDAEVVIQLSQGVRFGTDPVLASAGGEGWDCAYDEQAHTVTCTRDTVEPGAAPPIAISTTVEATSGSLQTSATATARTSMGTVSGSVQSEQVTVTQTNPPDPEPEPQRIFLPLITR
jgi:hypothetical protein